MSEQKGPARDDRLVHWRLSGQAWLGLLVLGLVLWLAITQAGVLAEVLLVLFGALLITVAIHPAARFLARWRIPPAVTVLGVYLVLAALMALVGRLVAPAIVQEVTALRQGGPELLQSVLATLAKVPLLGSLIPSTQVLAQDLTQRLDVLLSTAVGTAASLGGLALDVVIMFILVVFVSADTGLWKRLRGNWIPERYRERVTDVGERLGRDLARWVWAQLAIVAFFVAVFSLGLGLLGVPFAFTIALLGGVLEVIPYLGGLTAVVLAVLSALTVRPLLAVWVVLFYLAVAELEAHVIQPALYGRITGLHPAVVLGALLLGVKLGGIAGVLFSVPLAVVIVSLLKEARIAWTGPEAETEEEVQEPDSSLMET
jgi:predicted PurR-regulated permease PerM